MEGSSSLSYKGSISDAISTARLQKKLFLVYVSGEDENSVRLEQLTWIDPNVADAVSKYCIFLHLKHGSVEASQFSAIYPQSSIPSITAVGLNGVIIWKNEGFITAENFVENIEKAWAALHLQETAAALLSVALSSRNSEPLQSDVSGHETVEPENSSTLETPMVLSDESSLPAGIEGGSSNVEQLIDRNVKKSSFDKNNTIHEEVCPESTDKCSKQIATEDQPKSSGESTEGFYSVGRSMDSHVTSTVEDVNTTAEGDGQIDECSTSNLAQANYPAVEDASEKPDSDNICGSETQNNGAHKSQNSTKSNEILLNIRLPNGNSLQAKFVITDTLSSVKSYVDQNQITAIGSYDLAIPYPRRTFGDEDMDRTFAEMGFPSRQAMIVVPHRQVNQAQRGLSSSNRQNNDIVSTSTATNGGSLGFLRRMLSYVNPFSYLGGNSNSSSAPVEHNSSLWHFRPNPDLQNHLSRAEASGHEQTPSSNTSNRSRTPTSRPFGSNIHTLRHDEDDRPPADRNTFWNGNSTQYGGNDR